MEKMFVEKQLASKDDKGMCNPKNCLYHQTKRKLNQWPILLRRKNCINSYEERETYCFTNKTVLKEWALFTNGSVVFF